MLVDWGVLAATTATFCVRTLASLGAGSAWREKVEPAFKKSGLDHELTRAFNAGFQGFVDVLKGPFDVDDVMDARLREMFADAGFQEILAELPRGRFEDVDAARARELFRGLGLPGSSDAVFEVAWAALGRRFRDQIAQTTHAAKLVELGQWDRIEGYLAGMAGPRRDESAVLAAYRRYLYDLYRLADTRGLFWREKEVTGEAIHLADVFVETLVQLRDSRRRRLPEEEDRPDDDGGIADRTVEAVGGPRYLEVREEPQFIAEVLAKERRLVILGPPGSGKSTLVRCLALALAAGEDARRPLDPGVAESTVPILLTLKTYASRLAKDPTLKLDVFVKD
ncbi:MAG: hypothetical protein GY856_32300, partial [bacterium]|nr:hypothetical protein [bacterium]